MCRKPQHVCSFFQIFFFYFLRLSTQLNTRTDIIAVGFHVCSEMRAQQSVSVCKLTLSPHTQHTAHTHSTHNKDKCFNASFDMFIHSQLAFCWSLHGLANPRNGFTLILSFFRASRCVLPPDWAPLSLATDLISHWLALIVCAKRGFQDLVSLSLF